MDKLRQYIALTVVGVVVILGAGWFLLVAPKHDEAAQIRTSVAARQSANAVLENQLRTLIAQRNELPKVQADLAAVAAKIPSTRAMPTLIRALTGITTAAGVDLISITPGPNSAVAAAPVVGRPAPAAQAGAGGAAATSAAGTLSAVPVALSVVGTYFTIERFLSGIEGLPRAMRVTAISLAPGGVAIKGGAPAAPVAGAPPTGTLTASISAQVYVAVGRTTGAVPALPGAPVVPAPAHS